MNNYYYSDRWSFWGAERRRISVIGPWNIEILHSLRSFRMTETRIVGVVLFLFIHLWFWGVNNGLKIMKTFICKIPPNLPLPKGGIIPLFGKEGLGEIFWKICLLNYGLLSNPHALCPLLYALCSMPFALCPLLYAPYSMPHALCPMLYALCVFSFKTDLHNKVSARSFEGNG